MENLSPGSVQFLAAHFPRIFHHCATENRTANHLSALQLGALLYATPCSIDMSDIIPLDLQGIRNKLEPLKISTLAYLLYHDQTELASTVWPHYTDQRASAMEKHLAEALFYTCGKGPHAQASITAILQIKTTWQAQEGIPFMAHRILVPFLDQCKTTLIPWEHWCANQAFVYLIWKLLPTSPPPLYKLPSLRPYLFDLENIVRHINHSDRSRQTIGETHLHYPTLLTPETATALLTYIPDVAMPVLALTYQLPYLTLPDVKEAVHCIDSCLQEKYDIPSLGACIQNWSMRGSCLDLCQLWQQYGLLSLEPHSPMQEGESVTPPSKKRRFAG